MFDAKKNMFAIGMFLVSVYENIFVLLAGNSSNLASLVTVF